MRPRKNYSREFKLSIARELETKSAAEVCREHELHPSLVARWKLEYEKSPTDAFQGHGKTWKDEARLAQCERLIGQLYAENQFLKKTLDSLQQRKMEAGVRGRYST